MIYTLDAQHCCNKINLYFTYLWTHLNNLFDQLIYMKHIFEPDLNSKLDA